MKKIFIICFMASLFFSDSFISYGAGNGNDTFLSEEIQEYCIEIGDMYCICPEFLMSIIETESRGQADAVGGSCKGLMQINARIHKKRMERLGVFDIYDPYSNILVGADYLSELFKDYEDPATVLMLYQGVRNALEKSEKGNISGYAKKILERSEELERKHGK